MEKGKPLVANKQYAFLVDLDKEKFTNLGLVHVEGNQEAVLMELSKKFREQMIAGQCLFIAEKHGETYGATYRASYEDWMLEENKEDPIYFDSAEHDERVRFHLTVNGREKEFLG